MVGFLLEERQYTILVHIWWGWDGFGFSSVLIDSRLSGKWVVLSLTWKHVEYSSCCVSALCALFQCVCALI